MPIALLRSNITLQQFPSVTIRPMKMTARAIRFAPVLVAGIQFLDDDVDGQPARHGALCEMDTARRG